MGAGGRPQPPDTHTCRVHAGAVAGDHGRHFAQRRDDLLRVEPARVLQHGQHRMLQQVRGAQQPVDLVRVDRLHKVVPVLCAPGVCAKAAQLLMLLLTGRGAGGRPASSAAMPVSGNVTCSRPDGSEVCRHGTAPDVTALPHLSGHGLPLVLQSSSPLFVMLVSRRAAASCPCCPKRHAAVVGKAHGVPSTGWPCTRHGIDGGGSRQPAQRATHPGPLAACSPRRWYTCRSSASPLPRTIGLPPAAARPLPSPLSQQARRSCSLLPQPTLSPTPISARQHRHRGVPTQRQRCCCCPVP